MKIKIDTVYIDLDGVIVDLMGACRESEELKEIEMAAIGEELKSYSIAKHFGAFTSELFWGKAIEEKIFLKAKVLGGAWSLLKFLSANFPRLFIATSTEGVADVALQKIQWLKKHHLYKHAILISNKELLAKPKTLLIDDCDLNVVKFQKAGGNAILFPQSYNGNYVKNPHQYIINTIKNEYEYRT